MTCDKRSCLLLFLINDLICFNLIFLFPNEPTTSLCHLLIKKKTILFNHSYLPFSFCFVRIQIILFPSQRNNCLDSFKSTFWWFTLLFNIGSISTVVLFTYWCTAHEFFLETTEFWTFYLQFVKGGEAETLTTRPLIQSTNLQAFTFTWKHKIKASPNSLLTEPSRCFHSIDICEFDIQPLGSWQYIRFIASEWHVWG